MATISVIIPVYNCEKYVEEAVASVLNQPFAELSVILVDDGSEDASPIICDRLASEHPQISALHKQNGGVSSARNAGIEFVLERFSDDIMGRYIAFLDADDSWEMGFFCDSVSNILECGYQLVGFQSCNCDANLKPIGKPGVMEAGLHQGGSEHVWIHSKEHFGAMFYAAQLLKHYDIRFLDGLRYSEDKIFSMQCLYLADTVWLENRAMYLYRHIRSSAMNTRKFGIAYYIPIVDGYLYLDEQMYQYANELRGHLLESKKCASCYIMDMIDEHYQQWGSKNEIDVLLEKRPDYMDAITASGYFTALQPEPRYLLYLSNPYRYIAKNYMLGMLYKIKRYLKRYAC